MADEKTIVRQIEQIAEDICDNYCKYPELYAAQYKDPDESESRLLSEKCDNCPLLRLV